MKLSHVGTKMVRMSGLRGIMEDIATTTATQADRRWLNLGIGNPAAIPAVCDTWQELTDAALRTSFRDVSCRYGASRGLPELIDAVTAYFTERYGWRIGPEHVAVGPGSQMLCFVAAALFTGPAGHGTDRLLLPVTPDYTGYQGLSLHHGGVTGVGPVVVPEGDRSFRYAADLAAVHRQRDVGLMLVSSPSNPAGRTVPPAELAALVADAETHDAPLVVDHAYGEPFPGIDRTGTPPAWHDRVIHTFSASKAGLPGDRVGIAIGDPAYLTPIVSFLANSVLHAPQLAQATLARALRGGALDALVAGTIRPFYRQRRRFAERLLADALPGDVAWRLYAADGGMFAWLWVDEPWFDDLALYRTLRDRGVFVVPGRHFFVPPLGPEPAPAHTRQCVRISITPDPDVLAEGVGHLAAALHDLRDRRPPRDRAGAPLLNARS